MERGDLIKIFDLRDNSSIGLALYIGKGSRGDIRIKDPDLLMVLWRGRIATFDLPHWGFEVINESR